jgi:hypothetical protein
MDLGHRVVAMVGPTPKRVICQTCFSQHNYRAPKSEAKTKVKATGSGAKAAAGSGAGRASGARARGEQDRKNEWEARIAGKAVTAFTRYSMERHFSPGDLILHSKFGEGYVAEIVDGGKVSVMFRDGPRTLAQKPAD